MASAREIRESVNAFLSRVGVSVTLAYVGQTTRDGWECDAWRVTVARTQAGGAKLETDYFTGLGHRKQVVPMPANRYRRGTLAYEEWARSAFKPQAPAAADVLHSLCMDGRAVNTSFSDWCDDFGYDSDSIKALNTYQACERIGRDMRAVFGAKLAELSELVQEL